jgi:hypothetical protein
MTELNNSLSATWYIKRPSVNGIRYHLSPSNMSSSSRIISFAVLRRRVGHYLDTVSVWLYYATPLYYCYDYKIYAGRATVAGHPTCGSCYAIGIIVPGLLSRLLLPSILTAIKATTTFIKERLRLGHQKRQLRISYCCF